LVEVIEGVKQFIYTSECCSVCWITSKTS